jgi:hypothetical protein
MTKTSIKKNSTVTKGTLDQKHTEILNRFEKLNKSLPYKKQKLIKLKTELNALINTKPKRYSNEKIRKKLYLMDMIKKLESEIESIENCSEQLNYISKTLPILIDYYDKENVSSGCLEETINYQVENGRKNILSYFYREAQNDSNNENTGSNRKHQSRGKRNIIDAHPHGNHSRAKLYDNYLSIMDSCYRKSNRNNNFCDRPECGGEKILSQNDGLLVCKKCGLSEPILITVEKPNYKEPSQDSGTYAYKRINHLTEILSQLQAKETTDIPSKVFENILRELKKRKIDKYDLDIFKLRRILKKLNYRKYYEHVPYILQIINGKEPPKFSRTDEMKIKKMFRDIQKPFAIFCPKNRKNFLNYSYVLHKFCELLDLDENINYFPLLKNNAKLLQHDKIWKNICGYMKWKFYKSL